MANVKVVVETTEKGSRNLTSYGQKLTSVLSTLTNVTAAAAGAGAVFKKAFDLSQEGANLNQLTISFERMNEQVFKMPDLLNQMSEAARGTIKETDLMAGLLTLSAGATDEVARAFAGAAPKLVEIAKASNVLNPALGDTQFLFDSISKGIKRQSPLILDNLGLNVKMGAAYSALAEKLGKSVEELDANERTMAVLNATMLAGDVLIKQVGGSVEGQADAWQQLTVQVGETIDEYKRLFADGIKPTVEALSGSAADAVDNIIEKNIAEATSVADVTEELKKLIAVRQDAGGFGLALTGTGQAVTQGIQDTLEHLAKTTNNAEELRAALEDVFGPDAVKDVTRYGQVIGRNQVVIDGLMFSFEDLVPLTRENSAAASELAEKMGRVGRVFETTDVTTENLAFNLDTAAGRLAFAAAMANDTEDAAARLEADLAAVNSTVERSPGLFEAFANSMIITDEAAFGVRDELGELISVTGLYNDLIANSQQQEDYAEAIRKIGDNADFAEQKADNLLGKLIGWPDGVSTTVDLNVVGLQKLSEAEALLRKLGGLGGPLPDSGGDIPTPGPSAPPPAFPSNPSAPTPPPLGGNLPASSQNAGVSTASAGASSAGSGGMNINIGPIIQQPGEDAEALANRVSVVLARQMRQLQTANIGSLQ